MLSRILFIMTTLSLLIFTSACASRSELGPVGGRLRPCPNSPNCVNSFSTESRHRIEPIQYKGERTAAHERLLNVIESMPRTTVRTAEPRYIHAEFRSFLFRFVDDVEFLFDEDRLLIHVRSASRVGYSDFGVNRKRVETIRRKFGEDL